MGAKFSPSLANLYMGWQERPRVFGGGNPFRTKIVVYLRFIDDLLLVVWGGVDLMSSMLVYFNENQLNQSFTGMTDSRSIFFLDICLTGMDGKVCSTLYRKPLSGNSLLLAQSGLPRHTIKGIPVGQFLHVRRICSYNYQFQKEARALYGRFLQRGYPRWMLERALTIARHKDRSDLINKVTCQKESNKRKNKKQS